MAADEAAMQWRLTASGAPCRFLIFAHLALGEHEFRHPGIVEIDEAARRVSFRPSPDWLWGQTYPLAVHHLVVDAPDAVEAIGSGALLFEGDAPRAADSYIAIRTGETRQFSFAIVGSLNDPVRAAALADTYAGGADAAETLPEARAFWAGLIGQREDAAPARDALSAIRPWFAHNAMVHLTVPRGLEQYTAAAWGTRDVCQGPVEFLLTHGHREPVKEILRILFAQQDEATGDWPQWFMLAPYSQIRDAHSHGDIIIWPLSSRRAIWPSSASGCCGMAGAPPLRPPRMSRPSSRACAAGSFRVRRLSATASAIGTIPFSPPIRHCASGW
jgi:hypothetical protein